MCDFELKFHRMLLICILIINDNISVVRNDDIVIKILLVFFLFVFVALLSCLLHDFAFPIVLLVFFIKRLKFILDKFYIAEIVITSIPTYYSYMSIKIFSSFYSFDCETHLELVYFHFNNAGVLGHKND